MEETVHSLKLGKTAQSSRRHLHDSPSKLGDSISRTKAGRDEASDEEGGTDKDALAFIRAKKHVQDVHRAKRK